MSRITEKRDVQDQLINHLMGIGLSFIPQNELPPDAITTSTSRLCR